MTTINTNTLYVIKPEIIIGCMIIKNNASCVTQFFFAIPDKEGCVHAAGELSRGRWLNGGPFSPAPKSTHWHQIVTKMRHRRCA